MEPPIHTLYLRSGGATTLIFMVEGAKAVSSLVMRSPMPWNMVVPPDSTTLALHDGLEGSVMNATGLLAHKAWLEQDFGTAETLGSHGDDVSVGQLISLLLVATLRCSLHLTVKVQSDVAKLLLRSNRAQSGSSSCTQSGLDPPSPTAEWHVAKHNPHRWALCGSHHRHCP
eukprot:Skav224236  [mRNA]  locus=scaffold939:1275891:1276804:- [translate_table: standard]